MDRGEGLAPSVTLDALAERVRPVTLARDRQLPVLPPLEPLLPGGGLRRGATVAVGADTGVRGAASLALALAAGPSQAGSWVVAVGLGSLGLVAAAQLGVALDRLAVVPDLSVTAAVGTGDDSGGAGAGVGDADLAGDGAGPGGGGEPGRGVGWAAVVAALVDGFDVVLVAGGPGVRRRAADVRRLVARVRERGAVLVAVGGDLPGERSPLRLTVTAGSWRGLSTGWGHLRGRRVSVAAGGRGEASRPRRVELWLPAGDGRVAAVDDPVRVLGGSGDRRGRDAPAAGAGGGVAAADGRLVVAEAVPLERSGHRAGEAHRGGSRRRVPEAAAVPRAGPAAGVEAVGSEAVS